MDNLDINTEKGRRAAELQHRAANIVFSKFGPHSFAHTPDDGENAAAVIDGFMLKDDTAIGIAEIKSRDSTLDEMMGAFKGEWILTFQKLEDIQIMSKKLRLPAFGLVYLVPSGVVLLVRLTDATGSYICKFRKAVTTTQATVNGGTANRMNAFISVKDAEQFHE